MPVNYSITAINDRLAGVVTAIDDSGNGILQILAGATVLSTIPFANPCGTVNGGILSFSVPLLDPSAANTGLATSAVVKDGAGVVMISGLTVGIPLSGADIVLSNGLNNTLITTGQTVELLSAQITGS